MAARARLAGYGDEYGAGEYGEVYGLGYGSDDAAAREDGGMRREPTANEIEEARQLALQLDEELAELLDGDGDVRTF